MTTLQQFNTVRDRLRPNSVLLRDIHTVYQWGERRDPEDILDLSSRLDGMIYCDEKLATLARCVYWAYRKATEGCLHPCRIMTAFCRRACCVMPREREAACRCATMTRSWRVHWRRKKQRSKWPISGWQHDDDHDHRAVMLVEQARILRSARCRSEQRFGFGFISTLGAQAEPY